MDQGGHQHDNSRTCGRVGGGGHFDDAVYEFLADGSAHGRICKDRLAVLETLLEEAFVLAISRTPPPLMSSNGQWLEGDLCRTEPVAVQIQEFLRDQSRSLDGLIHCPVSYGADQRHPYLDSRDAEWEEVMEVNVRSQFLLTRRLLPLMLQQPDAFIVAFSSDVATCPAPETIANSCSKAASHALFSGLSAELSRSSVSVIQIRPERQVVTRGARHRRPSNFDFSGYSSPDIVKAPIRSIVKARGRGMNGRCLSIR